MKKYLLHAGLCCMMSLLHVGSAQAQTKYFNPSQDVKRHETARTQAVRRLPETHTLTLIDEDFSVLTEGSESAISSTPLTDSGDEARYEVKASLKDGKWMGSNLYSAGGAIALRGQSTSMGCLATPLNDFSGHLTISYRAKAVGSSTTQLIVAPQRGGYEEQATIDGTPQYTYAILNPTSWSEITVEIENRSADKDGYILFSTPGTVLIDDIKVVTTFNSLTYPSLHAPQDVTATAFTANWDPVRESEDYLFSLYKKVYTSDDDGIYKLDFDDGILPDDWTFKLHSDEPFVDSDGGKALKIVNNDTIIPLLNNNAFLRNVTFKMQAHNATEEQLESAYVMLLIDNKWTKGGLLGYLNGKYFTEAVQVDYEEMTENNFDGYYSGCGMIVRGLPQGAYFTIDDIEITTERPFIYEPLMENIVVNGLEYRVTGTDPDLYYYYTVAAHSGDEVAVSPLQVVLNLQAPTQQVATNITPDGYTANWKTVGKATSYEVRNYVKLSIDEDMEDYALLDEDFSGVTSEITDSKNPAVPESLGNENLVYFNQYGLTSEDGQGWFGKGNSVCVGMVGCDEMSDDYCYMVTPELDLSHGDGSFKVYIKAHGIYGDAIGIHDQMNVQTDKPMAEAAFEPAGLIRVGVEPAIGSQGYFEGTLTVEGGHSGMRLLLMTYGTAWMLDEIRVTQNVTSNDEMLQLLDMKEINAPRTSCTFSGLSKYEAKKFYYNVTAIAEDRDFYTISEASELQEIDLEKLSSSVENIDLSQLRITSSGRSIHVHLGTASDIHIYDTAGREVAAKQKADGDNSFVVETPGVYIVKTNNRHAKVFVR